MGNRVVLSGVEDWVGMEAFAEEKEAWLRGFLELPNGIPSHDPLSDVLGRIDPVAFRTAFAAWATAALPNLADEQICQTIIDAGADYVLALKDNHPTLCADVQLGLETEVARGRLTVTETVERKTTAGSKSAATPSAMESTGWRPNRTGLASKPSVGWNPSGSSATEPAPNAVIFCALSWIAIGLRPRCAVTGASKTNSIGSWTCNLAKMPVGRAPITRRKIWP